MKTIKATAYGPKGSTFKCNWLRVSLADLQRLTAHATLKGWPEVDITHFTETGAVHFWPPGYVTKPNRRVASIAREEEQTGDEPSTIVYITQNPEEPKS